jgi:hypothetical protein
MTVESNMEAPQKPKNRSTIWSNNTTPGIYSKECTPEYNKKTCTPMFIAALFTITKLWKQLRSPTTD